MIQSQLFTAGQIFGQGIESLRIPDYERYGLTQLILVDYVHDAVMQWFNQAEPVVKDKYLSRLPVSGVSSFTTLRSTSGGTYTAATKVLGVVGATFTSAALGCSVLIYSTNVYRGMIASVTSSTTVVLAGVELPTGNLANAEVFVWGRSQDIALGSLQLAEITMRGGIPTNLAIESDTLGQIPFVDDAQRQTALMYATKYTQAALATLYADTIKIFQGAALVSLGNTTLIAPLLPTKATTASTLVSVPDNFCPDVIDLFTIRLARHLVKQPDQDVANRARAVLDSYMLLTKEHDEAR